ncbi:iron-sulfur cluster assembly accessory protein [Aphanothece hegewaldii CCALA 016]|uniref:Iron-sulfur cluster assembly accessory protein n=1 Tax=Aphanothece hegewaldii CCALA 016 TaxID=2107694 RepID=A0A2T1LXD7_9CHRO|nr:iron-sulfur cluster assembly accessory protein [Aphanothece hegewaldii]PSF36846.1 iron-sulfur cluster assembly accessory protein [Aphanothece hegewaldii CCALA 016]
MIELTPAAVKEIKRLQKSRQQLNTYLRIGIKTGGCSGLYYDLEFTQQPESSDRLEKSQDINIVIDLSCDPYLQNLKLDYAEDLMGGGFRFHNPQASATCGCGLSFET